jgi:hypothetical protein
MRRPDRALDRFYPIVFLDALRIKIRNDHHVINKAVYLAIAINMEGRKEVIVKMSLLIEKKIYHGNDTFFRKNI